MNKVEIVTLLSEKLPVSQIYIDEPMKKYTSFKIGGNAEILVKIRKIKELEHVIHVAPENLVLDMDNIINSIRKDKKQTNTDITAVLMEDNMSLRVVKDVSVKEIEKAIEYVFNFLK